MVNTLADERQRFNFEIEVEKIKINVERLVVEEETGKMILPADFGRSVKLLLAPLAVPFQQVLCNQTMNGVAACCKTLPSMQKHSASLHLTSQNLSDTHAQL
jgi:hypothetical protein